MAGYRRRFGLAKAEGVCVDEVASDRDFVKHCNVIIDPGCMRSLDIPLVKVRQVIRQNNMYVGGHAIELSEHEFIVQARGSAEFECSSPDLACKANPKIVPER